VAYLSYFIEYPATVISDVSYSSRLGFDKLSTGDFRNKISGGFLQYARQIMRLPSNQPRPIHSASFYFISCHAALHVHTDNLLS
jgi:hypothetical protein